MKVGGTKADGWRPSSYHIFIKKQKNKIERRRARLDPECQPAYGRYKGYES